MWLWLTWVCPCFFFAIGLFYQIPQLAKTTAYLRAWLKQQMITPLRGQGGVLNLIALVPLQVQACSSRMLEMSLYVWEVAVVELSILLPKAANQVHFSSFQIFCKFCKGNFANSLVF
ncbi:unnamed protein product [Musa acuminata subsp. burmannicoides]